VKPLLRMMDKAVMMGRAGECLGGSLDDLPSDVFRNHVYVNPFWEDDVVALVDTIGAERVLFGSDYPHPEGLANPLAYSSKLVHSLPDTAVRKIMHDNAASLLGLSVAR